MLTVTSTNGETEPARSGALEDPVIERATPAAMAIARAGCPVRSASASALAERMRAEDLHHGAADLASAPFER